MKKSDLHLTRTDWQAIIVALQEHIYGPLKFYVGRFIDNPKGRRGFYMGNSGVCQTAILQVSFKDIVTALEPYLDKQTATDYENELIKDAIDWEIEPIREASARHQLTLRAYLPTLQKLLKHTQGKSTWPSQSKAA